MWFKVLGSGLPSPTVLLTSYKCQSLGAILYGVVNSPFPLSVPPSPHIMRFRVKGPGSQGFRVHGRSKPQFKLIWGVFKPSFRDPKP